jgi:hypothetical protein
MRLIHARMPRYILLVLSVLAIVCAALTPLASNETMFMHPDKSAFTYPEHVSSVVGIHQVQSSKHFSMPSWFILFILYIAIALLRSRLPSYRFDTPYMILLRSQYLRPLKFTSRFVARPLACTIQQSLTDEENNNDDNEHEHGETNEERERAFRQRASIENRYTGS